MKRAATPATVPGWADLGHAGLLLDPQRLGAVAAHVPAPLSSWAEGELRRRAARLLDGGAEVGEFVAFVLESVCGFAPGATDADGAWLRGSAVPAEWGRQALTGETVRPRQLWRGPRGAALPLFVDDERRVGVGRGRRTASQVVHWLRASDRRLALLTNGRQWRLVFAGLDIDAWCEWDADLWFEEGELAPQVQALRTLVQPELWTPPADGERAPLEQAILDSRKGQAELSAVLGERVREAVELLVQAHGEALREHDEAARGGDALAPGPAHVAASVAAPDLALDPPDIYRAAVRMAMRMVVALFAESRELLPRDNALYNDSYGLTGLIGELEKAAARGGSRLARSYAAWPRVLALFRLVSQGSAHPALPVPAYGGELFAPGDAGSPDGLSRALALFEAACFARELLSDRDVHRMLELITRTRIRLRQGRGSTWVTMPVDFSDLSSEYIGILYEGLLDFELKTAPPGDPVVFLAVGNTPALPLSRLEAMDDRAIAGLLDKMKDTSGGDEGGGAEAGDEGSAGDDADTSGAEAGAQATLDGEVGSAGKETGDGEEADADEAEGAEEDDGADESAADERHTTRTRAETWARRAVLAGKLVRAPKGSQTPEKRLAHEAAVGRKARQLVQRVVLPGEWYVVRWGGTRKGSGTFYTRPGLAVPTVQRTLRPLAFDPPTHADGSPNSDAPPAAWKPRPPEEILALKVCDPACGSGTFPVAALRYLTDAVYESLHYHDRIREDGERALVRLFEPVAGEAAPAGPDAAPEERLGQELLPCRPDDDTFEPRLKALLRRHVVERCIYGVDLDPLAVELCRLSLWIETMDRQLPFSFLDHKVKCGNALVGAWFDTFRHYPVMAFKDREGGDKGHANGVHFARDARGKALKAFVKDVLTPDLRRYLGGRQLFDQTDPLEQAAAVHDGALATLARLHDLPVHDAAERARLYRDELLGSAAYRQLKAAMDLWCACWFWPADRLAEAPLPTTFAAPPEPTAALAARIAARKRFFHWELEFPDVFRAPGSGFDAMLGNPPWETLQPSSMEYFSNVDPLFRSYAKQQALGRQSVYFQDVSIERDWLAYLAGFVDYSNWVKNAASPFGVGVSGAAAGTRLFAITRGPDNKALHDRWHAARAASSGFASAEHPFRFGGGGKAYTYKLFLEQAHGLLNDTGRLGMIVPSGLYSDHATDRLRRLFLDGSRWEWVFGFENKEHIFDIHRSFKFNPVIIARGGTTEAISAAFMRHALEDWERAEDIAIRYPRPQVARLSPASLALLEIQSAQDLQILDRVYSTSTLVSDSDGEAWGLRFTQGDFNMTTDSSLFPPRPRWESEGYRPDEYSRWVLGRWRPLAELWADLGIDPAEVAPTTAAAEGGVASNWRVRCAAAPYDCLPVPRADLPEGVVLSREADAWLREDEITGTALPLYQGTMVQAFMPSARGWLSGTGLGAQWDHWASQPLRWSPQYLMASEDAVTRIPSPAALKIGYREVARSTDTRSVIAAVLAPFPAGHKVPVLTVEGLDGRLTLAATALLDSFVFDWVVRQRLGSAALAWYVLEQAPLPPRDSVSSGLASLAARLNLLSPVFAGAVVAANIESLVQPDRLAFLTAERLRLRVAIDAIVAAGYGLGSKDLHHVLRGCDHSLVQGFPRDPMGFWRVDKDKDPELRHTVLALVAFCDLEEKIRARGGDRDAGIEAFLAQNDGEGWMLPETLRLTDYGLGHDERAKQPQPVASRLGPRFYDWQLAQSAEESWRECHLHARNLLGGEGYSGLVVHDESVGPSPTITHVEPTTEARGAQEALF